MNVTETTCVTQVSLSLTRARAREFDEECRVRFDTGRRDARQSATIPLHLVRRVKDIFYRRQ